MCAEPARRRIPCEGRRLIAPATVIATPASHRHRRYAGSDESSPCRCRAPAPGRGWGRALFLPRPGHRRKLTTDHARAARVGVDHGHRIRRCASQTRRRRRSPWSRKPGPTTANQRRRPGSAASRGRSRRSGCQVVSPAYRTQSRHPHGGGLSGHNALATAGPQRLQRVIHLRRGRLMHQHRPRDNNKPLITARHGFSA